MPPNISKLETQKRSDFKTATQVQALLEVMKGLDENFFEGDNALKDPSAVLEGYRWIFSIVQVALDVYVWGDTNKPRFTEIVGPNKKWGGDNSDAFYFATPISPDRTYRVSVDPGDAVYLSNTVYGGPDDGAWSERIVGTLNTTQMKPDPDGKYSMILSPDESRKENDNFIKLEPDAVVSVTRDYMHHPKTGEKARWNIECLDPAPPYKEDDADLARRFKAAITWVKDQISMVPLELGQVNHIDDPFMVQEVTRGWAAGDAAYGLGAFELAEDEALVLKGKSPECVFWNLCLWNQFMHTFNYDYDDVTINSGTIELEDDGSWVVTISHADLSGEAGVKNWVFTQNRPHGRIWIRWFLPEATPEPITSEVVKVSSLKP